MSILPPSANDDDDDDDSDVNNNKNQNRKDKKPTTILPEYNKTSGSSKRPRKSRRSNKTSRQRPTNSNSNSNSNSTSSIHNDDDDGDEDSTPLLRKRTSKHEQGHLSRSRQNLTIIEDEEQDGNEGIDLQEWYKTNYPHENIVLDDQDCLHMHRHTSKGVTTWSATFTCPRTKETFVCGILRNVPKSKYLVRKVSLNDDEQQKQHNDSNDGAGVEQRVTYYRKRMARSAAMARALDCFQFRVVKQITKSQICKETPYHYNNNNNKNNKNHYNVADSDTTKEETTPKFKVVSTKPIIRRVADSELQIDQEDSDDDDDADDELDEDFASESEGEYCSDYDEDDSDDEEYTITYLPGTSPSGDNPLQNLANPMSRVLGGWNDATLALQCEMEHVPVILQRQPEQELERLIQNAQDWIEQELPSAHDRRAQHSEHRVLLKSSGSPRTLDIANTILMGLAKAHRRIEFSDKPRGVEKVATEIVNYLWTTLSAQPNADTYASYVACLEGPDPKVVADRALTLLEKMKSGEPVDSSIVGGKVYPKPTIEVTNAVIQLHAQLGGHSARDIFYSVEDPNRVTFLSVLSSMSYPAVADDSTTASSFDPVFAQECIDQMQALADENQNDETWIPDLQVYNSGLRWSGGIQSTLSRPYARPLSWDLHADIFQEGFQEFDENSRLVQDAYRMHAWLEKMAGIGGSITPNIETYEAVIQAYIRTGTEEGVKHAESLLTSLLESPAYAHTLRMQTFHPIVAAWAYLGHDDGPAKVDEWIEILEDLGKKSDHSLQIDSRVREASLLAHAQRMRKMIEMATKNFKTTAETGKLVDTAYGCCIHLKDMCARLQEESSENHTNSLLDVRVFVLVLDTWGKLGLHLLDSNEPERAQLALEKMYEVVEEYESLLLALHKRHPSTSDRKRDMQLQHMTGNAHQVYAAFLSFLKDSMHLHNSVLSNNGSGWLHGGLMSSIEQWVRRIDEFGLVNNSDTFKEYSNDIVYSDMYSYSAGSEPRDGCEVPSDFLIQVIEYLRHDSPVTALAERRGEVIRLLFLTMDVLSVQNDQTSLTGSFEDIVDTVCKLSNSPEEREALLSRVQNRVEWMQANATGSLTAAIDHEAIEMKIRKHSSVVSRDVVSGRPPSHRRNFRRRSGRSRSTSRNRKAGTGTNTKT